MKNLYILLSIALISILASCGSQVVAPSTQTGTDTTQETPVEITAEEEELIAELIQEVSEEVVEEEPAVEVVEEDEGELPVLDLSTAVFSGNGTEPFWGFNASGSTLLLREASDTGPMDLTTYSGMIMTNMPWGVAISGPGVSLDLTLGTCSDGMSDIVYAYSSVFVDGPTNYTGCANLD